MAHIADDKQYDKQCSPGGQAHIMSKQLWALIFKISCWACFLGSAPLPSLGYGEDVRLWGEKARLAWGLLKIGAAGGEIGRMEVSRPLCLTDGVVVFRQLRSFGQHLARSGVEVSRGQN